MNVGYIKNKHKVILLLYNIEHLKTFLKEVKQHDLYNGGHIKFYTENDLLIYEFYDIISNTEKCCITTEDIKTLIPIYEDLIYHREVLKKDKILNNTPPEKYIFYLSATKILDQFIEYLITNKIIKE